MSVQSYIQAMPKVELCVSLEGAVSVDTLVSIAEQNDIPFTFKAYRKWLQRYQQPVYEEVDEVIKTVAAWFQQPEDLSRLVYTLGISLAKQNVSYAEVSFNPLLYAENGLTFEQVLNALNDGRSRLERGWPIRLQWVLSLRRDNLLRADDILRWCSSTAAHKGGVVGMIINGRERHLPVDELERVMKTAHKKGIPFSVQCMESVSGVRRVLELAEPSRLLVGVTAALDNDVRRILAERQIGVCVASGWGQPHQAGAVPMAEALRMLYDDGIRFCLSVPMPYFQASTLLDEFAGSLGVGGLSIPELESSIQNAVVISMQTDEVKAALLTQVKQEFDSLRLRHEVNS